jgi:hypothetical protein
VRTQGQRDAQTVTIASALLGFVVGGGLVLGAAYLVGTVVTLGDGVTSAVPLVALLVGLLLGARALRR